MHNQYQAIARILLDRRRRNEEMYKNFHLQIDWSILAMEGHTDQATATKMINRIKAYGIA